MMIDLNQIYKGLNGNDKGFNKLRIFWRIKISRICDRAISLVFGIVPEHRKKGLASAALSLHYKRMKALGATHMTGGGDPFYQKLGYEKGYHCTIWRK